MFKKEEEGITLVALVITIVILIILAGVSLSLVLGENSILNQGKKAGEDYTAAQEEEAALLTNVEKWLENTTR